jgi:PST family polysaccharide transporter
MRESGGSSLKTRTWPMPLSGVMLDSQAEEQRVSRLTASARTGTHALFATRLLSVVLTFASITLLARLVPPRDFGIWAMAGLALGLVTIVRELGLVSSIVQAPTLTPRQQDAYFWTSVAISLACALALALAAPLLGRIYEAPLLVPVVWGCSLSVALSGMGLVHVALLRRQLLYGRLAVMEAGAMVFGLVVGVLAAWRWHSVWALLVGHLASTAWMCAAALLLCPWVPGRPRRGADINLGFSFELMSYNLLTYAGNNVGLAAGYRFGHAELGFFNRGQQLYNLAHFSLLTPITEMGLALLCRLKSDASYIRAYICIARRMAVLFIPYAFVLPFVSSDLILALLGPNWSPASPILAWFAPAVLAQALSTVLAQLLTSQERGEALRRWAVANLVFRAAGAIAGSHYGIVGMAAGFSIASLLATAPMFWVAGQRGPVHFRHQAEALWHGVLLGLVSAAAAAAALASADALALPAGWWRLAYIGGAAALAWGAVCLAVRPARDALTGRSLTHA